MLQFCANLEVDDDVGSLSVVPDVAVLAIDELRACKLTEGRHRLVCAELHIGDLNQLGNAHAEVIQHIFNNALYQEIGFVVVDRNEA